MTLCRVYDDKPAVHLSHRIGMFSLQHFFSFLAPDEKMEIRKFLPIMSAVNLPPSPFFSLLAPRSVFTRIPQYCTSASASAAVVALSNWLVSTSKPCWCCCCFCCSSHSKEKPRRSRTPTHELQPKLCRLVCVTCIGGCRTQQI